MKFFVAYGDKPERQVSKEEFVRAERTVGLHNTMGQPKEPATSSFSGASAPFGRGESISGRIEH